MISRDRLVVRTLRNAARFEWSRSNPGSNPGPGISFFFANPLNNIFAKVQENCQPKCSLSVYVLAIKQSSRGHLWPQ